jgi:hypothetical protein
VFIRLLLLAVFWIGARYTAYRHPDVNVMTIVLALLAFVVIVSMILRSRWWKHSCH